MTEDDYPIVECPKCHTTATDLDGFGFLFCAKCGHCTHPSSTDGVCGLCSQPLPRPHCEHKHGSGLMDSRGNGEFTCHDCGDTLVLGRGLQPQPSGDSQ